MQEFQTRSTRYIHAWYIPVKSVSVNVPESLLCCCSIHVSSVLCITTTGVVAVVISIADKLIIIIVHVNNHSELQTIATCCVLKIYAIVAS